MNPTRARLLDVLMQMGLRISVTQLDEIHGELVGSLQIEGATLKGTTLAGADSAALIDEIPVLAAIAPYTEQGIEVRDAKELRIKESDRIAAIATNLRQMGAQVEEREDGLKIPGRQNLHGAELDSFHDHRIAMAFAVAGLRAKGETLIRGAESGGAIREMGHYVTFAGEDGEPLAYLHPIDAIGVSDAICAVPPSLVMRRTPRCKSSATSRTVFV